MSDETKGGLTVGQLRRALEGVPDEFEIVVRAEDVDGHCFCGGVLAAAREVSHVDDGDFFVIDCTDDVDELAEVTE